MEIRNSRFDDWQCEPTLTSGGRKRTRGGGDAIDESVRLKHPQKLSTQESPFVGALRIDGARCTSTQLLDLGADVLSVIAWRLSLCEFANLAVLCRTMKALPWLPQLGRETISEMGCAITGRDILAAVTRAPTMRSDWLPELYLSFAKKTQCVALRDHALLTEAWNTRLSALERDEAMMAYPNARYDFDALRWFTMSIASRHARCSMGFDFANAIFPVPAFAVLRDIPGPSLIRILEGILPLHQGSVGYAEMVSYASRAVRYNASVHYNAFKTRCISVPLVADIAIAILVSSPRPSENTCAKLSGCFGFSQDDLRRLVDPIVVETILDRVDCRNASALYMNGEQWRSNDEAFHRLLGDSAERRAVTCVLDYADVKSPTYNLLSEIERASVATFWPLCDLASKLPAHTAPRMMRRLATCLIYTLRSVDSGRGGGRLNFESIFDFFLAWRDQVAQSCTMPQDGSVLAQAFAVPLIVLSGHYNDIRLRGKVRAAAEEGFARLPPRFWTEILEVLIRSKCPFLEEQGESEHFQAFVRVTPLIQEYDRQSEVLGHFICDPASSADHSQKVLVSAVTHLAPRLWTKLPDRGDMGMSRMAVFSRRFSLSYEQRQTLRLKVLESIADEVFHGGFTIHESMGKAGLLEDPADFRRVEDIVWGWALNFSVASYDWQDALRSATRSSAQLRNRAEVYIAGTTGIPVLEPV